MGNILFLLQNCGQSRDFSPVESIAQNSVFFTYGPGDRIDCLEILSDLFRTALCQVSNFSGNYSKIVDLKKRCLVLLENSSRACQDEFLPLLLESLKCHQVAYEHFSKRERTEACKAMAATTMLANQLKTAHDRLSSQWEGLSTEMSDFMVEVASQENDALEGLVQTLFKINGVFLDFKGILNTCCQFSLDNSLLADPDCVALMVDQEGAKDEFLNLMEEALGCAQPQVITQCKGPSLLLPSGTKENRDLAALLRSSIGGGIKNEFYRSCASWLTLGWINQRVSKIADNIQKDI